MSSSSGAAVVTALSMACFSTGKALTGERALGHEQILGLHDSHVAGDHVAGRQLNDIAGHQLGQRDLAGCSVAQRPSR